MRILVLANFDVGLYNFRKELLQTLICMGNEVYISLPYGKKVEDLKKIGCKFIETDIDRRGMNPFADSKLIFRYFRIIKKIKPDKVIAYTIKPNIYGGIVCRLRGIPFYANVTGLGTAFNGSKLLGKLAEHMYKTAFKHAKAVFFENEENRDFLVDMGIVADGITHCLSGAGVNLEEYAPLEYPKKDSAVHFLFIGRVMKEKGVDELFAAAKRLFEEGAVIDVVGPFEDDYTEIVEKLDGEGVIKYYGYQENVKPFIANSHCIVLPSWHEGMANTLLEGGASGRALIASNIHGCCEAVKDGVTGYLAAPKDAEDLYLKMKAFLDMPYDDKVKMGLRSRELIADKFDRNRVVSQTVREIFK